MAVPIRSALVALATVALAATAAGCGSSGGGTNSNTTPAASAAATSSAATAPGVTAAEQAVSSHLATPTSIGITTKVPGKIPAGKVIAFMDCGTPACHELYTQFAVAAKFLH